MSTRKCISDADIGRLLDDDVTSQEKQSLHEHIETCLLCRTRWQQVSTGAGQLDNLFALTVKKAQTPDKCLSENVLAGFVNQTLGKTERCKAEHHLAQCSCCRDRLASKFAESYEKEGNKWWSEYAASQMLGLLALAADQIDGLVEFLSIETSQSVHSTTIIKLPLLEPAQEQARRLAAATGEGFSVQTLRQQEPPFEFELAQFGEQLRITARPLQKDSPYDNCLARLKIFERDVCRWSEVILIDKGECKCVLEPEQTHNLRPEQVHLTLRLEPIVTLEQLVASGTQAYVPILKRLLKNKDPEIRSAAIKVAARIYGPEANSLIEPLIDDKDEMVRQVAKEALNRFPKS